MPTELTRVLFTFGREYEVRYVITAPAIGDRVRRGARLWRVSSTAEDDLGLTVVCTRCGQPRDVRL
jgi:hypothetical protein